MTVGMLVNFVACGDDGEGGENGTGDGSDTVEVLRFIKDIDKNAKVVKSAIQLVTVHKDLVPEDAISAENEALGKFLIDPVCAGEFVVAKKLMSKLPTNKNEDGSTSDDYIVVPEHVSLAGDISDSLQKLIDNNPNRTLYFPDGIYRIGKTVKTSSDPAKSVSFELSTYAQIVPHNDWKGDREDPLISFGGADKGGKGSVETKTGNECFIRGGIFNGEDKCSGLTIEGTGRVFVHNLSMKNVHIGIDIKADYTDIDNVVITGTNTGESIGVLVQSSYNTLTNMRIFHIHTGIKLLEGRNVLRNLHPLYAGASKTSCGFWDLSEGNYYDICYSDHFAVGFRMTSDTVSFYNGCFAYWYNGENHQKHWGFECSDAETLEELNTASSFTGSFNSIIRNTRVDLNYKDCDSTYLRVWSQGGMGLLLDPTLVGGGGDDHAGDYSTHLKTEKH